MTLKIQVNTASLTDGSLLDILLQSDNPTERIAIIGQILSRRGRFDFAFCRKFAGIIEQLGLYDSLQLTELLEKNESPLSRWLQTHAAIFHQDYAAAACLLTRIIDSNEGPLHEARLLYSTVLLKNNDLGGSYSALQDAIASSNDYGFLMRASKLLDRLRKVAPSKLRNVKIALLSNSTMDFYAPLLRTLLFREGFLAEIYISPFANLRQEILNPNSGLYAAKPDFVFLMQSWRDSGVQSYTATPDGQVKEIVEEAENYWRLILEKIPCRIIQSNYDLPAADAYGTIGFSTANCRMNQLRAVNSELLKRTPASVIILDVDFISGCFGKYAWNDHAYWFTAKQHPNLNALPTLINRQIGLVKAGLGAAKKVVVLDLDNTLWGGIIGEDGLEGIKLGAPSASGEAYLMFQRYLLELKERGILLTVCSKNNEEDAQQPFLRHDATALHLDDFVVFKANWQEKSKNIREIAETLNLGLDSFVFIDDNPVERAQVKKEIPEISVPDVTADPLSFIEAIETFRYFESWSFSSEDRERHASYRGNVKREILKSSSGSIDDFLRDLQMSSTAAPFNPIVLSRVVQLIGKTNQFNLTTIRYSEEQVVRMMNSEQYWTQYFSLKDRFGDNGIVGIMIARDVQSSTHQWEIDTWLMSCRVIGRQMEDFMFGIMLEAAKERNVEQVIGIYRPTKKNILVTGLYERLGFTPAPDNGDDERKYVLDLRVQQVMQQSHIRLSSVR
jgi:FkbH-like protein